MRKVSTSNNFQNFPFSKKIIDTRKVDGFENADIELLEQVNLNSIGIKCHAGYLD